MVRRSAACAPPVSTVTPLDQATYERCSRALATLRAPGSPIILSYATSIREPWLLGLSAARAGLPLVVSGLGHSSGQYRWYWGFARKVPWGARAAEMVARAMAPHNPPVIWTDSTDTIVLPPLAGSAASVVSHVLRHQADGRHVAYIGGECNSWPRCYEREYEADAAHLDCRTRSKQCYPK
eukprot:7385658-Prymnesium_polylepis.1